MWGKCWEIKDKIGEKKIQGARNCWGGTFWGNAKKGVEKLFGGSKKWGRIFQEKFKKKKSPGGILWKIVQTNLGGIF